MAEQEEQLFADAADALPAPLEGDEPAEGDDVFYDSEEELPERADEELMQRLMAQAKVVVDIANDGWEEDIDSDDDCFV